MAKWHTQEPARFEGQELSAGKKLLRDYYKRARIESAEDGPLNPLLVTSEDDGTGVVRFECLVSSLRYWVRIPKATRKEKAAVKAQQQEGYSPTCPRCTPADRLVRNAGYLICPHCGVRYGSP